MIGGEKQMRIEEVVGCSHSGQFEGNGEGGSLTEGDSSYVYNQHFFIGGS